MAENDVMAKMDMEKSDRSRELRTPLNQALNDATVIKVYIPSTGANANWENAPISDLVSGKIKLNVILEPLMRITEGSLRDSKTSSPKRAVLEIRTIMPISRFVGQVGICALVEAIDDVPVDVRPQEASDFASFDPNAVNAFDLSAVGKGSVINCVVDVSQNVEVMQCNVGYVSMIASVPDLTLRELCFRLVDPLDAAIRSSSDMFPYAGELIDGGDMLDLQTIIAQQDMPAGAAFTRMLEQSASESVQSGVKDTELQIQQIMNQRCGD